jgi:hypothetical protein
MKQYQHKEYDGEWEYKQAYRQKTGKRKEQIIKKTTYPWKNYQKSIRST